jgi:hypothetical protein
MRTLGASTLGQFCTLPYDNLTMRYFFVVVVFISCSCDKKTADNGANFKEVRQDSLAAFPLDSQMEFIGTNSNDQIVLLFRREMSDTFKYRIELLRKWKGMPFDHGKVRMKKITSDSTYFFEGVNSDCNILIKIYKKNGKFSSDTFASLERRCKHDSMNIAAEEFPEMWNKSGRLR